MRGVAPGTVHLARDGGLLVDEDERIRRQELEQRAARSAPGSPLPAPLGLHGENRHALDLPAGALRVEVEGPERDDLVTPPFDSGRRPHPEPVHIQDPTAHAELRDVNDHADPLVAYLAQSADGSAQRHASRFPLPASRREHQPGRFERRRHPRPLRARAGGRHEHPHPAREQRLERFDPLARDLKVRLLRSQALALRVERGTFGEQRLHVRQPALGVGRRRRNHGEHPLWEAAGQGGDQHSRTGAGKACQRET